MESAGRFKRVEGLAGDLRQQQRRRAQLPLGLDDPGGRAVACGKGLVDLGDPDQPRSKAATRRCQLSIDGGERGLPRGDGILRGQHVEVELRHTKGQVLA